jgi:hypothetical protein
MIEPARKHGPFDPRWLKVVERGASRAIADAAAERAKVVGAEAAVASWETDGGFVSEPGTV